MSEASCCVVSCGIRLPEVALAEIRKPQVRYLNRKQSFDAGAQSQYRPGSPLPNVRIDATGDDNLRRGNPFPGREPTLER